MKVHRSGMARGPAADDIETNDINTVRIIVAFIHLLLIHFASIRCIAENLIRAQEIRTMKYRQ